MKKLLLGILAVFTMFIAVDNTYARAKQEGDVAKIGANYYANLDDALVEASATELTTIEVIDDFTIDHQIIINKKIKLDLGGHTISFDAKGHYADGTYRKGSEVALKVDGGELTVTGAGTLQEVEKYYAPLLISGSTNKDAENYSTLTVDKDVKIIGCNGIIVRENGNAAYGVNVYFHGTIEAVNDIGGDTGIGINVNGKIKAQDNSGFIPYIHLSETAKISSTGVGIYAAGYAYWSFEGATITAVESVFGIKSGALDIIGGTYTTTGKDLRPTEEQGNGINPSGSVIQIETNPNKYAGNINLYIQNGTFTSENGSVFYEYSAEENQTTEVETLTVSGGEFYAGDEEKTIFDVTESFKQTVEKSIAGGSYNGDVSEHVIDGFVSLTLIAEVEKESYSEVVVIPKGTALKEEDVKELKKLLNETLEIEGYTFDDFYSDKELTKKFDFTKEINEDVSVYLKFVELKEELPAKTSDINLIMLIGGIIVAIGGIIVSSKKRLSNNI